MRPHCKYTICSQKKWAGNQKCSRSYLKHLTPDDATALKTKTKWRSIKNKNKTDHEWVLRVLHECCGTVNVRFLLFQQWCPPPTTNHRFSFALATMQNIFVSNGTTFYCGARKKFRHGGKNTAGRYENTLQPMFSNENTFQKIYGKRENRCLFCCPGLRPFSGGYCVCLFLLIFEGWFRQNICVFSLRWSWPLPPDMEHPRRKRCFFGPPPGTNMFYTVQYPDVFGVRKCNEGIKPDFLLAGWEATVGKAGMVWGRIWPRGGRSPRRDGIPNCANFSGPKQHICLAPAELRTAKKHQKLTNGNKAVKKSDIMIAASKTGR